MANYSVFIKPSAAKELRAVRGKKERARIVARVRARAEDPQPAGSQKLSGSDRYRVRQGADRIVYSVDDNAREMLVVKIGHRRDVSRGL